MTCKLAWTSWSMLTCCHLGLAATQTFVTDFVTKDHVEPDKCLVQTRFLRNCMHILIYLCYLAMTVLQSIRHEALLEVRRPH